MACSTPDFPDLHHLPEFTQTYVHLVSDAIQPSHFCSSFLLPSVFLNIKVFSSECVVISYCDSELHFSNKIMILKVFLCTCIVQLLSHGWLCNPMDGSPSGSSAHGTFQARILEWVAVFFSRWSFQPRKKSWVSCIAGRFFTVWANIPGHLYCHMNYRITLSISKKKKKINQLINQSYWNLICSVFIDLLWENWINNMHLLTHKLNIPPHLF